MKLIFVNGNEIEVSDISTITGINITVNSYTELDTILANFTVENMKRVTLGDKVYTAVIPQSVTINDDFGDDEITAYIVCREKTDIEIMAEQITENQEAITELAEMIGG